MVRPLWAQSPLGLNATDAPRPAIAASGTSASDPAPPLTSRYPLVTFDHRSSAVAALPFDQPFLLSDAGDSSLLQVTLWYPRGNLLTDDECRAGPPPDSLLAEYRRREGRLMENGQPDTSHSAQRKWLAFPRARWTRAAGQGNAVLLPVNALPPNRDFTFCVESVNTPSASEAAEFRRAASRNLRAVIVEAFAGDAQNVDSLLHTVEMLYTFHAALRRALPRADSLVFTGGSILRPATEPRDTALTRQLAEKFAEFSNADHARSASTRRASETDSLLTTILGAADTSRLKRSLAVLGAQQVTSGLPERFAHAAALAATIVHINRKEASAIAWGQRTLDQPKELPELGRPERQTTTELAGWIARLDTTGTLLRDLSTFAMWVREAGLIQGKRILSAPDAAMLVTALDAARFDVLTMSSSLAQVRDALARMDASIEDLAANVSSVDLMRVGIRGTSSHVYETRARWYLSQDLGVLLIRHGSDVQEAAGYVGANIYLRAVNKDAPLGGWCFATHISCFLRRFSLTLGVTATNVEVHDRYSGVLGGKALYAGAGFRIADFFRVNYGAPLVYTYSPDSGRRRRLTAFSGFGLSLDFQLKDLISNVASAITP
jgi:hypothetical protein